MQEGAEILEFKAKCSRKSSAYHKARLEAKKQGLSEEEIKAAARKVTWSELCAFSFTLSSLWSSYACAPATYKLSTAKAYAETE